ncbi:cardiolipin synthase [Clostridium punense]|uniref:Cardiolipin synthase n=1 Tax=Clostridium punense TaxID=1054297 RepID=A0ABS4K6A1_9CLOT|nr:MULTISPECIES: cardiolipin synthase [Clostridium]EQB89642.1 hypothetical protein M918_19560 [Clostridium sp. BL8]MBP2023308.1 cardiolipin synthase [Clostridium punense]
MSLFFGIVYLLNFITILTILFVERKKQSVAFTWILIMTFLPVVGFILYPFIGRNLRPNQKKLFKLKRKFDILYKERLQQKNLLSSEDTISYLRENSHCYEGIISMNYKAGNSVYSEDNTVDIFTNGVDKFHSLLNDIENAKETIHMLYYIVNNDDIGCKVVSALTKKAKEGVEVRLLYDHVGSILTPQKMFKELIKAGGNVCRFFPLSLGTYTRINYRNHRKIVVIDGKIGYIGGMNIGDEYLGLHKYFTPWRDTHLRITGTSVYAIQERFLMDWYYASNAKEDTDAAALNKFFPPFQSHGNIGMQVLSSGPDVSGEQIKRGYIKMITSAKERIFIQTPYFIPDESFLEALQIAALSGVDVRIMLPSIADHIIVHYATSSYLNDILPYGIKVYFYNGFLHSKMIVIDGEVVSIGTANMDIRSFSSNFEVNTFIYNTEFSNKCNAIYENDMASSKEITKESYASRGRKVKIKEGLCRLLSPLL